MTRISSVSNPKLEKVNGVIAQAIYRVYTKDIRAVLDEQLHFVPIDYNTISLALANKLDEKFPSKNIESLYAEILEYFTKPDSTNSLPINKKLIVNKSNTFTTESGAVIDSALKLREKVSPKTKSYKYITALVYNESGTLIGVLAPNFNTASTQVITKLFNSKLKSYLKSYENKLNKDGTKTKISEGFDLGHIYGSSTSLSGLITATPATDKTKEILAEIDRNLKTISDAGQRKKLSSMLDGIKARFDALKNHSIYAPQVISNIDKTFSDTALSLGLTINVVIPQDRYENQGIYAALYEAPILRYILDEMKTMNFSRNLVQEINHRISNTLLNKSAKNTKSSASAKSKPTTINIKAKNPVISSQSGTNSQSSTRISTSESFNLNNLQSLLDMHLQDVVAANMGNGNDKKVLNYRTGRLAASAKVERLSQSREGMITAFYTYMKNPYATFSEGGRQQYPKSRDPKLLISKSIKEIAATKAITRMRAVLV